MNMPVSMLPVPLEKSFRLLNHGPTVLVTSAHGERRNIMAAAWNMPLDYTPPKVAVVIDKNAYTRELIEASGTFALSLPCRAQARLTVDVGNCSGRDGDKFSRFDIEAFAATKISAPIPAGCIGWLECRIIPEPHIQETYDLFLGEIIAAYADETVFSQGHWHFDDLKKRSIHYVAGGHFFATGEAFDVGMSGE